MANKLHYVITNYVKLKGDDVLAGSDENNKEFMQALEERLEEEIKEELREEMYLEAVNRAGEEIDKRAGIKRISEIKKLLLNGFIVSLFVGLLANQLTEIIDFIKGDTVEHIISTSVVSGILLIICILIFIYMFINEFIRFMSRGDDKSEDN